MLTDFASRFDSFYDARYDLRCYHECKSYREEGDGYRLWEPQDESDLEPVSPAYAPGAMMRGELDDYDCSDCDEF